MASTRSIRDIYQMGPRGSGPSTMNDGGFYQPIGRAPGGPSPRRPGAANPGSVVSVSNGRSMPSMSGSNGYSGGASPGYAGTGGGQLARPYGIVGGPTREPYPAPRTNMPTIRRPMPMPETRRGW